MRSSIKAVLLATLFFASSRVNAEPERVDANPESPSEVARPIPAAQGAFLPFTVAPATGATMGTLTSGYDDARKVVLYQALADAHVVGGLSLRAGYSSNDLAGQPSALVGARFHLLTQERYGLDFGVGLFYEPHDIEGEGLVRGTLALGRRFGELALFGTAGYGQDPEGDDHRAELSAAMLYTIVPAFYVGFDGRARALVFSSDEKHDGLSEPVLDFSAGPLAQFLVGPVALSGQFGVSAVRYATHGMVPRSSETRLGPMALVGAGLFL
jgi:hypothetical protein